MQSRKSGRCRIIDNCFCSTYNRTLLVANLREAGQPLTHRPAGAGCAPHGRPSDLRCVKGQQVLVPGQFRLQPHQVAVVRQPEVHGRAEAVKRTSLLDQLGHPAADLPLTRGVVPAQSAPSNMLGYIYILRCRDQRYYFGSTNDLIRRLAEHRAGRVRSTKPRLPVELVYFEECETLDQARQRERSLKNGRTRRKTIDFLSRSFPRDRLAPFA